VAVATLYFACGSGGTAAGLALGLGLLKAHARKLAAAAARSGAAREHVPSARRHGNSAGGPKTSKEGDPSGAAAAAPLAAAAAAAAVAAAAATAAAATAAAVVLGLGGAELVALGVDDTPEDFYTKIDAIHAGMGTVVCACVGGWVLGYLLPSRHYFTPPLPL
jgi:hypothetical protein